MKQWYRDFIVILPPALVLGLAYGILKSLVDIANNGTGPLDPIGYTIVTTIDRIGLMTVISLFLAIFLTFLRWFFSLLGVDLDKAMSKDKNRKR
jgi:hypothetical protein